MWSTVFRLSKSPTDDRGKHVSTHCLLDHPRVLWMYILSINPLDYRLAPDHHPANTGRGVIGNMILMVHESFVGCMEHPAGTR